MPSLLCQAMPRIPVDNQRDDRAWGGWASGAFYPDFPVILIDNVELVEIRTVTEEEVSESSDQSEEVISLKEFKTLA